MIVAKFGGSALADGKNWKKILDITENDHYHAVVLSAPGARFKGDKKVTDLLYEYFFEKKPREKDIIWQKIAARYENIADFFCLDIKQLLEETRLLTLKADLPFVVSRGEFLCAEIFARVSGRTHVDSAKVIKFDDEGEVLQKLTEQLVKDACVKKNERFALGGFYGSNPQGEIRLFERGGSDVTGAWVASALDAEIYQNWTDVGGFFVCDPRIVPNPQKVACLSFEQLKILSTLGASVLHPLSVYPTQRKNIPINIRSLFKPCDEGTLVLPNTARRGEVIGITALDALCFNCIRHKNTPAFEESTLLFSCGNCGFFTAVVKKEGFEENTLPHTEGILFKKETVLLSLLADGKQKNASKVKQALKKHGLECKVLCDDFGLTMCATTPCKKEEALTAVYRQFFL